MDNQEVTLDDRTIPLEDVPLSEDGDKGTLDGEQGTQEVQADVTAAIREQTQQLVESLPQYDVDGLTDEVRGISEQLRTMGEGDTDTQDLTTVSIDATQWAEMRESWTWAKGSMQLAMFGLLVCDVLVAVLVGVLLFEKLSGGWRHA